MPMEQGKIECELLITNIIKKMNKKLELLREAVNCYRVNHASGDINAKELLSFIDEIEALILPVVVKSVKEKEILTFQDWANINRYYQKNNEWFDEHGYPRMKEALIEMYEEEHQL